LNKIGVHKNRLQNHKLNTVTVPLSPLTQCDDAIMQVLKIFLLLLDSAVVVAEGSATLKLVVKNATIVDTRYVLGEYNTGESSEYSKHVHLFKGLLSIFGCSVYVFNRF